MSKDSFNRNEGDCAATTINDSTIKAGAMNNIAKNPDTMFGIK